MAQCTAKSKQSNSRCKNNATIGKKVCRFHGGRSTGAKTVEGIDRIKKANTKNGQFTKESIAERKTFRDNIKTYKTILKTGDQHA